MFLGPTIQTLLKPFRLRQLVHGVWVLALGPKLTPLWRKEVLARGSIRCASNPGAQHGNLHAAGSPGLEAVGSQSTAQRRHAAIPATSTSAGRLEYCITTVLDTQSFGEEAHHSLSHALELFPRFRVPLQSMSPR